MEGGEQSLLWDGEKWCGKWQVCSRGRGQTIKENRETGLRWGMGAKTVSVSKYNWVYLDSILDYVK